jgi:hypothetical protein
MEAFQAEQEQQRLQKQKECEMAKLLKSQKMAQKASTEFTRPSQLSRVSQSQARAQSQSQQKEAEDCGKLFVRQDYKNIFSYLEDSQNYMDLFGDDSRTLVGVKKMTKLQAFEVFATWMNFQNPELLLSGRPLQQRIDQ